MQLLLVDDDEGTLRVIHGDQCIRWWHYTDKTRRTTYFVARSFLDGWTACMERAQA
jgi:hypothetical protein